MQQPFDKVVGIITTAFYEPSSITEVVMAYCFLGMLTAVEIVAPVGIIGQPAFFWIDKLGILLLCYCLSAAVLDVMVPGRFDILNFWNWLCGGKLS